MFLGPTDLLLRFVRSVPRHQPRLPADGWLWRIWKGGEMLFDIHKPQEQPAGNRSPLVRTQLAWVWIRSVCVEPFFFFPRLPSLLWSPADRCWVRTASLQVLGAAETSRRSASLGSHSPLEKQHQNKTMHASDPCRCEKYSGTLHGLWSALPV